MLRARLHQEHSNGDGALQDLDKASALSPDDLEIRTLKVQMLRFMGRKDDAERNLQAILKDHPDYVPALYGLAITRRFSSGDPLIQRMEGLLKNEDLHALDRVKLLFGLGKAYDHCGMHADAMSRFQDGHELRRSLDSKPRSWLLDMQGLTSMYTAPDFFASAPSTPRGKTTPIFIVGLPRSGSTLVEQIFDAHPSVQSYGETHHLSHSLRDGLKRRTDTDQFSALSQLTETDLDDIQNDYFARLAQHAPLKPFVVDKSLANMLSVAAIRFVFPQAKVIYCRRDVRDMGLSMYFNYFGDEDNAIGFSHGFEDIAIHARSYDALALIWENVIPGFVVSLSYEKLVTAFEPTVRKLLDHCGLEWDDACLSFQPKDKPVRTISTLQVREGINTKGIGKWKPYEAYIGPLVAYAVETATRDWQLPEI